MPHRTPPESLAIGFRSALTHLEERPPPSPAHGTHFCAPQISTGAPPSAKGHKVSAVPLLSPSSSSPLSEATHNGTAPSRRSSLKPFSSTSASPPSIPRSQSAISRALHSPLPASPLAPEPHVSPKHDCVSTCGSPQVDTVPQCPSCSDKCLFLCHRSALPSLSPGS